MSHDSDHTPEQSSADVRLHIYTFREEEGRLRVLESAGELGCALALWGTMTLLSLGALAGLPGMLDPEAGGWWLLLFPAALAALGLWLFVRTIRRGRTLWIFDRTSGNVYYRGKVLRTMASITHIGRFAMDVSKDLPDVGVLYYAWFVPNQGHDYVPNDALGLRKDLLGFASLKDANQAATILANYLGVEVVSQLIE